VVIILSYHRKMFLKFSSYGFLKNLRFFEPFLYLFFLTSGLSYFQIGLLIAVREGFVNVFEIPSGIMADLTGRRRVMAIAFLSYMVSFTIFYLFGNFLIFIPAMILFSLGETFRSGTHKSMIMEHLDRENMEDKRVEFYGKTRAASRLGSAISAVLAALIVFFWGGYNVIFLATLIPYSLGFVLMLTYPKKLDGETSENPRRDIWNHTVNSFKHLFSESHLKNMFLNSSTHDAFFKVSKDYLSPIVESFALSIPLFLGLAGEQRTAIMVGLVYFFVYLSSFISSMKSSDILKRVGNLPKALNILFYSLSGFFLLIGLTFNLNITIISIIAFLFLFVLKNIRRPMVVGYLSDYIEPQKRATLLSAESQLRSIFGVIIAPILGFLADFAGLDYTFIAGGIMLLVLGMIFRIKKSKSE